MSLALKGTAEELASSRAEKVLATASYASIPLSRVAVSVDDLKVFSPFAKSLVLSYGERTHVTASNTMMRTIALIAPTSGLLGQTEEEYAYIDGWLAFIWSSIDLPLQVLAGGANEAIQKDLDLALAKLEMHLQHKEFMVGQTITLADISLAVSLQGAREVTKPKEKSNLSRWYQNTISLPFFSPNPQPAASIK